MCMKSWDDTVAMAGGQLLGSSGLQDSISDPPPPGRAEVRSRDTVELEPRLLHLLVVSYLLALQGLQSENPLWDLKRRQTYGLDKCSIYNHWRAALCERLSAPVRMWSGSPLPDHWFRWQCGPPSPGGSLWCGCFASWSLWCRRPPLSRSQGRDKHGVRAKVITNEKMVTHYSYKRTDVFLRFLLPSKQQGGGSWEWLSRSTLNTCTSGWLLDE